jgi:hypothetical protein
MSWSAGCDIDDLTGIVFSLLSSLVIDGVAEQDGVIVVRARTASWPVPFPRRGALTGQVQGFTAGRSRTCLRTAARCSCGWGAADFCHG